MRKQKKDIVDIAILLLSFNTWKKINYWFLILYAGFFFSASTLYGIMVGFNIQSSILRNVYLYIIPFVLYSYLIHIIIKNLSKDTLIGIILLIYFGHCLFFYRVLVYIITFTVVLFLLLISGSFCEWREE